MFPFLVVVGLAMMQSVRLSGYVEDLQLQLRQEIDHGSIVAVTEQLANSVNTTKCDSPTNPIWKPPVEVVVAPRQGRSWTLNASHPCFDILRDFHLLNDCYRSYDGSACLHLQGDLYNQTIPTNHNSSSSHFNKRNNTSNRLIMLSRPEPVYVWAAYPGHGFGRMLQYTVISCIVALNAGRSCVINPTPRDEYYTFRSFVNIGSYNWISDTADYTHGTSIQDAIKKLKTSQTWDEDDILDYDNLLPMVPRDPRQRRTSFGSQSKYDYWKQQPTKLLLSPSWGSEWLGAIAVGLRSTPTCPLESIKTHFQNAMWAPTPLTKSIFAKRRAEILGDTTTNSDEPYGAVHIRTYFLLIGIQDESKKQKRMDKSIQQLTKCIERYSSNNPTIRKWWILSDKPEMAINLTNAILQRQSQTRTGNSRTTNITADVPFITATHGYTKQFQKHNRHSSGAMKGIYNHMELEPSIMDWMTLHESTVAFTYDGAFAETGARGNGKILTNGVCNGLRVYQRESY